MESASSLISARSAFRFSSTASEESLVACDGFGGADAFALERGFGIGDGLVGQLLLRVEAFAALHAFELGVFEAADLGLGERDLVLEGGDLHGGGCEVDLLADTRDLGLVVFDIGLLASAQSLFFGDEIEDDGALAFDCLGFGLERGDVLRQRGDLIAEPFGFDVVGLQDNQFFKIGMHPNLSTS